MVGITSKHTDFSDLTIPVHEPVHGDAISVATAMYRFDF